MKNEKYVENAPPKKTRRKKKDIFDVLIKKHKCYKCLKYKSGLEFYQSNNKRKMSKLCIECETIRTQERKKYLCPECNQRTDIIHSNTLCPSCNRKFGLQECRRCKELKFVLVEFNTRKTVCDNCCS